MEPKAHPQLRKAEKAYDAAETNAHKWRQFLSMIGGTATGGATGAGLGYMGGAGLRALGANVNPASAAKAVGYPSAAVGAMLGSLLGGSHGQSDVDLGRAHERLWNAEQKYASPRISLYSFFDELKQIPSGGFGKIAKELTEAARGKIKAKNFALTPGQSSTGEKAYPIQDRAHASNALSRVAQHGSPKQKAEVYKDVAKKYPDLARKSEVPALKAKAKESQMSMGAMSGTSALPGMVGGPPGGTGVTTVPPMQGRM